MGLDMYAKTLDRAPQCAVDFEYEGQDAGDLHYWRKHPNLHGWMEKLYRAKGGKAESFNCVPVVLTLEDLDQLEKIIKEHRLPETNGFFFGASCLDEDEIADDMDFITKARSAIADGATVFYDSWW